MKPRSRSTSTTGPCGTSSAIATTLAAPVIDCTQSASSASPAPLCGNSRSPATPPRASSTQAWCFSEPQSTAANQPIVSSAIYLSLLASHEPPRRLPIPVPALEGATSYWASPWPTCRGTSPTLVLAARVREWSLPTGRPARSAYADTGRALPLVQVREWAKDSLGFARETIIGTVGEGE